MSVSICNACTRCAGTFMKSTRWLARTNHQQIRNLRLYQEKTVRLMYWRGRSFDRVQYDFKRNQRHEWNYRSEIYAFSRRLQENLSEDTLRQVFTHESYTKEITDTQAKLNLPDLNIKSNSQLIEQGDHLLDELIKPYLRYHFSRVPEDGIIQITNYLKSDDVLADVARWIGCKDIILAKEYPPADRTMADTVKALVAAIQMDQPDRTQRFVVDIIISYLNDKDILDDVWIIPNPKETLNMLLANSQLPAYEPRLMFETGVKTLEQCHVVGLYTNQKFLGSSAGETVKIAERFAAMDALQSLFDLKEDRAPFVYGERSEHINYGDNQKEHSYVDTWKFKLV